MPAFIIFDNLKVCLVYIFLFIFSAVRCQDKIYFLDGTTTIAKVLEISDEQLLVKSEGEEKNISRSDILLVEFSNGKVEVFNTPEQNVVYDPDMGQNKLTPVDGKEFVATNFASVNTLALCNADVAAFYEHVLANGYVGLGVMGAYNFNIHASISNLFIAILNNPRKRYDLGAFANLYLGGLENDQTTFYAGVLLKYMKFDFTKVEEIKSQIGSTISSTVKYTPTSGSQLATLFTFGSHSNIGKNFFIKTIFGMGGFNMRGDYKQQYNYYINGGPGSTNPQQTYTRGFLLKMYLGINVGFTF